MRGYVVASRTDRDPLLARASALRGRLHIRSERRDLAAQDLESALSYRQNDQRLAADLAECCLELGQVVQYGVVQ